MNRTFDCTFLTQSVQAEIMQETFIVKPDIELYPTPNYFRVSPQRIQMIQWCFSSRVSPQWHRECNGFLWILFYHVLHIIVIGTYGWCM